MPAPSSRPSATIPVLCTGGFQTAAIIEEAIARGDCDAVTIARPLIANNDLVQQFASGIGRPANPCTYCNRCLVNAPENPLGCYEESRFPSREAMIQEILSVYQAADVPVSGARHPRHERPRREAEGPDLDARLRRIEPLADEIRAIRGSRWLTAPDASASRRKRIARGPSDALLQLSVRNIVLRVGRPVLAVVGDAPQLQFTDSESAVWRSRLQASGDRLQLAARAVGRIDVTGLPDLPYVGTGWLVDKNTIVTNRHVAREFGRRMPRRASRSRTEAAPSR